MSNHRTNSTFSRRDALKAGSLALAGVLGHTEFSAASNPQQPATNRAAKTLYLAPENSLDPAVHSRAENLFWADVMAEHAGFFAMLMPGPELATQRGQAESFQRSFQNQFDRAKSTTFDRTNYAAFNRSTVEMMKPFIEYKRRMLDAQDLGRIRTLVFSTFFDHTAREAERASLRLQKLSHGDVTLNHSEVIDFWSGIMSDHGEFTAHLLDPKEESMSGEARDLSARFLGIGEANRVTGVPGSQITLVLEELTDFQAALEKGLDEALIKSIMHPTLAHHFRRETLKFVDELKRSAKRT
jgi:hypothetical protein